jgi:hypothetical protein
MKMRSNSAAAVCWRRLFLPVVGWERRIIVCHTWFLRPKPDAHRMYAQDQVVIHMVRM